MAPKKGKHGRPPPKSPFLAPRRTSVGGGAGGIVGGSSSDHSLGASKTGSSSSLADVLLVNPDVEPEHKSTLLGCTANLITAIVGAGIIGIPYAMRETGLVAGWFLMCLSGALGCKSLRLLVEMARHVDAPSYEVMAEAVFGKAGWGACNLLMFFMSWGPMLSYFMLIKDTLGSISGYPGENCLVVSSLLVMLPLCLQRDMADLAKTSKVSVLFNLGLVGIVAAFSPTSESISKEGGLVEVLSQSTFRPETCFIGLGVISFAFSCQHSSLIIAGSLGNPTRERWGTVSLVALAFCSVLSLVMGTFGYVGFLEETDGNVLNNFPMPREAESAADLVSARAANVARGFVCGTMFFVYPLESFVARHVVATNLFRGREAHEGDDHSVLDRWDRRAAITVALYLSVLFPALHYDDVGIVLAWTGTVAATALSYIGPGALFVGVHGREFLDLAEGAWGEGGRPGFAGRMAWYVLGMPLWCKIAERGNRGLASYYRRKELMTPAGVYRLGKVKHKHQLMTTHAQRRSMDDLLGDQPEKERLVSDDVVVEKTSVELGLITATAGTAGGGYGSVAEGNGSQPEVDEIEAEAEEDGEDDPQDERQGVADFAVAIGFVLFGVVSFTAGVYSIYTSG